MVPEDGPGSRVPEVVPSELAQTRAEMAQTRAEMAELRRQIACDVRPGHRMEGQPAAEG